MKLRPIIFSATLVLLVSTAQNVQARTLPHLDAEERAVAEKEYNVDSVEQINMRNKVLFTEYYIDRSDQYGPYPAKTRSKTISLRPVRDGRRFPAFAPSVSFLSRSDLRRAYLAPSMQKNIHVKNVYYNEPIVERNKLPGITFYNNFSAFDGYTERW